MAHFLTSGYVPSHPAFTDPVMPIAAVPRPLSARAHFPGGGPALPDAATAAAIAECFAGMFCATYDRHGTFLWVSDGFAAVTAPHDVLAPTSSAPTSTATAAHRRALFGRNITEFFPTAWCRERLAIINQVITASQPVAFTEVFRGRRTEAVIFPGSLEVAQPGVMYIGRCGLTDAPAAALPAAPPSLSHPIFLLEADWGPLANRSRRQLEVLRLIAQGFDNHEIARVIYRTKRAVEWHINILYQAFHCDTRIDLFRIGFTCGLHNIDDASWTLLMDRVDESQRHRHGLHEPAPATDPSEQMGLD